MNKKRVIQKILVLAAWVLVLTGMTILLVAANAKREEHVCSKVLVTIKGSGDKFYIDEADIKRQLERAGGKLVNKPVSQINLILLEKSLENDQWIRNAELYFDKDNALHVYAVEREPIARVFTTNGSTFYIDSSGHRMSLLQKLSIRVPVITGFLNTIKGAKDSALLHEVKKLAWFIYSHPFWMAQTGQVDITADRKFEIIPVVGDHLIRLGDASDLEAKFNHLSVFYKQVLSKTGFNKYAVVDAQFAGQIIGVHKGTVSTVDSLQLQKNIGELLQRSTIRNLSEEMMPLATTTDSVNRQMLPVAIAPMPESVPERDTVLVKKAAGKEKPKPAAPVIVAPQSKPKTSQSKTSNPKKNQPKKMAGKVQKPKAVMQPSGANQY